MRVCEREHKVQIPKSTKGSLVPHAKGPTSLLGLRQRLHCRARCPHRKHFIHITTESWMTSERENILYFMKSFFLGCCSVAQSCLTLCDPMDCSTPGLPVLHYLPESAQTHVHGISDAIQPSHPPPPALNLSQHQGLFQ